jgi:F-type H+-transporting ATPase subunit b
MQAELDVANEKADAEISAKTAESEARIAEVRAGALDAIREVSKEVSSEIVKALGASADDAAIAAAVDARVKG